MGICSNTAAWGSHPLRRAVFDSVLLEKSPTTPSRQSFAETSYREGIGSLEAFRDDALELLVPRAAPDLYIAGAALRAEGPESRQLVAALSRNANESAAQCGSSSDSPLEEDGFELVVPDFRATFFLCFRAQNWPRATPVLMTDNGSFSVSRARLARVPNPPEGGNARRWQSGASTPLLDC